MMSLNAYMVDQCIKNFIRFSCFEFLKKGLTSVLPRAKVHNFANLSGLAPGLAQSAELDLGVEFVWTYEI